LKNVQNLIQITYDAGTTGEVLSPVRGDSEEIVVGAHGAPVDAPPEEPPVNAPVDAPPEEPPVNEPAMDAPVNAPVDAPATDAAADVLDRVGLTREEVSRLPPDLRDLHTFLINAPEDTVGARFMIPPGMFLLDLCSKSYHLLIIFYICYIYELNVIYILFHEFYIYI